MPKLNFLEQPELELNLYQSLSQLVPYRALFKLATRMHKVQQTIHNINEIE